jgi:hypothetical protein
MNFPYTDYIYPQINNNNLTITLLWNSFTSQILKIDIPDIDKDSSISISVYKKTEDGLIPVLINKGKWQSYINTDENKHKKKKVELGSRLYKIIQYQPSECCLQPSDGVKSICKLSDFNKEPEPITKYIFNPDIHVFAFPFLQDTGIISHAIFATAFRSDTDYQIPFKMGDNISTVCTEIQLYTLDAQVYDTILTRTEFHDYEWEQISGTQVIWTTDRFALRVTIDINEVKEDRQFKFYIDRGTDLEQSVILYMFNGPSDNLNATLDSGFDAKYDNYTYSSFTAESINDLEIIPIPTGITDLTEFINDTSGTVFFNEHNNYILSWTYDESATANDTFSEFIEFAVIENEPITDVNSVLSTDSDSSSNTSFLQNPAHNNKYGISANVLDGYFRRIISTQSIQYANSKEMKVYSNLNISLESSISIDPVSNLTSEIVTRFGKEIFDNLNITLISGIETNINEIDNNVQNLSTVILTKLIKEKIDNLIITLESSVNKPDIDNYLVEILTKQDL